MKAYHESMTMAALVLAAFFVFSGTITHDLVWDDLDLIETVGERVRTGGLHRLLLDDFRLQPEQPLGYYRPVVMASIWTDTILGGGSPWMYHLSSVLLHCSVTALLFLLARVMTGSLVAASAASLIFAVHPTHTESVAFVSGRTDVWACLFVLLSVLAWICGRQRGGTPVLYVTVSSLALFLGTLSKESALMLPVVLWAWDLIVKNQGSRDTGWARRNLPWFLGWAIAVGLSLWLRQNATGFVFGRGDGRILSIQGRTVPVILSVYLRLLSIPWPLNAYYTEREVALTWLTAAGATVAILLLLLAAGRRERRAGWVVFPWILGFLAPVLGLVPIPSSLVAERFLYLPSVGFALAVGMMVQRYLRAPALRKPTLMLFGLVVALSAYGTMARSRVWQNDILFFSNLERSSPTYPYAPFNLGNALLAKGQAENAKAAFQRSISLDPTNVSFLKNLGGAYRALGEFDEAAAVLDRALDIDPDNSGVHFNRGTVLMLAKRHEEAVESFGEALESDPDCLACLINKGLALQAIGHLEAAEESFTEAVELWPDNAVARFNLGLLLAKTKRRDDALNQLKALKGLDSDLAIRLEIFLQES